MKMKYDDVISVIIPVYNVENYLERCLQTVISQTYSNLQIILVDDGSTDSSGELCDQWAKKDTRITVVHKANGGPSSARNAGLDVATGNYIAFVDSDDWIEKDMFESLLKCMKESNTKIARCGIGRVEEFEVHDAMNASSSSYCLMNLVEAASTVWENGFMCNKLFSAELFQNEPCIRFDSNIKYGEDQLVLLDCLVKCGDMADMTDVKYNYFINPNSLTGVEFNLNKITTTIGFKHMCEVCDEHIPVLSDLFKSKYYSVCVGFLLQKKTRKSKEHKAALSSELRKNLKEILKLHNMSVKFKLAAAILSFI